MPEPTDDANVPAQPVPPAPPVPAPGSAPPPPSTPDTQDGADDGRTWFARLVGALLMLFPLLLVYLLISLWPRPDGSIKCDQPQGQQGQQSRPAAPAGGAQDEQDREEKKEQWAPCATIYPFEKNFNLSADIRIIILVLLVGALGAFVHAAQSFTTYIGNRKFKKQWTWWYLLRVPIGAALALFIYFTARGGLLSGTTPTSKTDDVNLFGIMSFAALAGLFSKQMVDKLSEVVSNFFNTEQDAQRKDKATDEEKPEGQTQAGGTAGAAGSGS